MSGDELTTWPVEHIASAPARPCKQCGASSSWQRVGVAGIRIPVRVWTCRCFEVRPAEAKAAMHHRLGTAGGVRSPGTWSAMSLEDVDWWEDWQEIKGEDGKPTYRKVGIKAHREAIESYLATLPERVAKGQGLWLRGDTGLGKSMVASLILTEAAKLGIGGRFEVAQEMIDGLTLGNGEARKAYRSALLAVPILVIDDLGTEDPTSRAQSALYDVINGRYNKGSEGVTIVTTNTSVTDLALRYGSLDRQAIDRLVDRLLGERCKPLVFKGESYRERMREDW